MMLGRAWTLLKAAVGIGLLVCGAVYAAQKLDRERGEEAAQDRAFARAPDAADTVRPRVQTPGGPTQRPSR